MKYNSKVKKFLNTLIIKINNSFVGSRYGRRAGVRWINPKDASQ